MSKVQLSPSMMEAAKYIPVYTRPDREEVKPPPIKKGCFDCNHSTQSMGERHYRSFFVYKVNPSLLSMTREFAVIVSFDDKFWGTTQNHFLLNFMGSPPYKFPRLLSYYQNGIDFPADHELYVRQYKLKNRPLVHANTTLTNEDLFEGKVDKDQRLLVIGQPASWGLGSYLSLDADDGRLRLEEVDVEDMRFQSIYKQRKFLKTHLNEDENPIFRVYPDGSTKKMPLRR